VAELITLNKGDIMAHEIKSTDKIVTAVHDVDGSQYPEPWHGLGERFREKRLMYAKEAMELANLGWTVEKEPHQIWNGKRGQRNYVDVPGKFNTVRTDLKGVDRFLGTVGEYYVPFQNVDAFDFMDSIIKDGQAAYDTAGSLFGGKKVWLLAQMPKNVIVAKDMVSKYLLLSHCHDGTGMIEMLFTPVRVVCNNTCRFAIKNAMNKIRVRHTKNAGAKLEAAKNAIGIASSYFENVGAAFGEMQKFDMKSAILKKYFEAVVPNPNNSESKNTRARNKRERLTELFETSPAIVGTSAEGNLWGALNSVTEFVQHEQTIPNYNGKNQDEQRFNNTVFVTSGATELRDRAFTEALNLLNN